MGVSDWSHLLMKAPTTDRLSPSPRLQGDDIADHARTMAHWFELNFTALDACPLQIKLAAERHQLVLRVAEAQAELTRAFPDAAAGAIEVAISRLTQRGSTAWVRSGAVCELESWREWPTAASPPAAAYGKPVRLSVLAVLAAALTVLLISLIWTLR
jgi:hypothetical protein